MTTLLPGTRFAPADDIVAPRGRNWERIGLAVLLIGTAAAYLWDLSASGWANSFYAAAAQAGSESWKAFFFGSSDAANSITVDKPPASLWLMSLSIRMFGLSSWSVLVPQALMGVGSVALLWATVRRYFGPAAGLLSGLALALTPVAVLMFRFNNPDALLVLLMIAAVWAMLRAVEDGRTRWLVLTGALVGFGFLTKQLQVMLVVPPLALAYLVAGPPRALKRVWQLFAAGASAVVAAGWWLLAVELWPTASRPWIGGSQHNSILELTIGYNGLGRLSGNETGSVGGGMGGGPGGPGGGGSMWGSTGIGRMFDSAQGGQIAWLIPAALLLLVLGIALRGKAPRIDAQRASFIVWGGWLLTTGLVFSYMAGIFHQYYTVALAPAIAALVGSGSVLAWRHRDRFVVRTALSATVVITAVMAWILLSRSTDFVPWLRWVVAGVAIVAALLIVLPGRAAVAGVLAAVLVALAGPVAYAAQTIATPHEGSIVSAGPNVEFGHGGPGGMRGGPGGGARMRHGGAVPGMPGGFRIPGGAGGPGGGMFGGPAGGLLNGSTPTAQVVDVLEHDSDAYTWVAATVGANSASGYQLATEQPVMPIGGFNGTDPAPTLGQFQQYVKDGRIHYFISGGMDRMGGTSDGTSAQIANWVAANYTSNTVDGVTLYDLSNPKS